VAPYGSREREINSNPEALHYNLGLQITFELTVEVQETITPSLIY
jgi:hypothetical protein